jgi:CDP-diacylglycerol--serine O-phosphatidyltransferase
MLLPLTIWLETGADWARDYRLIGPWVLLISFLMISNVATFSWSSIRIRRAFRFMALAGVGLYAAALIAAPWVALIVASLVYALLIPFSIVGYAKVKRARRAQSA